MSAAGAKTAVAPADTFLGLTPAQIVSLVGTIAGAAFPEAAVAGMTIAQITGLAVGVANEAPAAIAAFEEIRKVRDAGIEPTPEQWASWNKAADDAHAAAQAAADKVINGDGA